MITLPALAFDRLAISINTHGLGAGRYYRYDLDRHVPVPLDFVAHFETCFGDCADAHRFGITTAMSDKAVYAINKRKRALPNARVNWTEFVGELGIYRGVVSSCDVSAHESSIGHGVDREAPDVTRMERRAMEGRARDR